MDIFRCKGVVAVKGEIEKHVLQGVHTLFNVEPITGLNWTENEKKITKLVFIGRYLDEEKLKNSFKTMCINKR